MTIDQLRSTVKVGTRMKQGDYHTIWQVISIEDRGPVIEIPGHGHRSLMEWHELESWSGREAWTILA